MAPVFAEPLRVIDCWRPYSQEPVLAGKQVLLAGSGDGFDLPVLQAIAPQQSEVLWTLAWTEETDEIEGGLPGVDAQGLIWQGLYARECCFALQAVNAQGERVGLWELETTDSDYPIYGCDATSKLIVAPTFCTGGYVVTGWIYRHREALSYVFSQKGELRHRLEGWPHAVLNGQVLLASVDQNCWESRQLATGELNWRLPMPEAYWLGSLGQDWVFGVQLEGKEPGSALEIRQPAGDGLVHQSLPGKALDVTPTAAGPVSLCQVQEARVLVYPDGSQRPLLEPSAWLPPQTGQPSGQQVLVQTPGHVSAWDHQGLLWQQDLPLTVLQTQLERAGYRAHNLLATAQHLLLRHDQQLWIAAVS